MAKKLDKRKKIIRTSITIGIIVALLVGITLLMYLTGWYQYFDEPEEIDRIINSGGGVWSRAIFFLIQFLQVTFIPIPAMVTTIAGVLIFGPLETFLISLASTLLGSIFAFYLGRVVGTKIVNWMVGEETCKKWQKTLSRGKYVFFLMMLFPAFPDDILCMVAGLTSMTWKFFIFTNIISRSINTFVMCYVTSGTIIPYHGWGIPVWIVLFGLMIILFVLSVRYQAQIENFAVRLGEKITSIFKRKKDKTSDKSKDTVNTVDEVESTKNTTVESATTHPSSDNESESIKDTAQSEPNNQSKPSESKTKKLTNTKTTKSSNKKSIQNSKKINNKKVKQSTNKIKK